MKQKAKVRSTIYTDVRTPVQFNVLIQTVWPRYLYRDWLLSKLDLVIRHTATGSNKCESEDLSLVILYTSLLYFRLVLPFNFLHFNSPSTIFLNNSIQRIQRALNKNLLNQVLHLQKDVRYTSESKIA